MHFMIWQLLKIYSKNNKVFVSPSLVSERFVLLLLSLHIFHADLPSYFLKFVTLSISSANISFLCHAYRLLQVARML
jgi:hypothetical protein